MQLIALIWLTILKERWQLEVPMRLRAQGIVLCSDRRFTVLGVNYRVVLRTLRHGVRVGRSSVIGAMSVVTKVVLADSIAVGCPARTLKPLDVL